MKIFLREAIRVFIRYFGYLPGLGRIIRFINFSPVSKTIFYSDSLFTVDTRRQIDWEVYYHGYYRPEVSLFIKHELARFLKPNPTMFDIGAASGTLAILLAEIARRKDGKVFTIECNKTPFLLLEKNIKINSYEKEIFPINVAVSDKDGEEIFYFPEDKSANIFNASRYSHTDSKNLRIAKKVRTQTLRSLIEERGIDNLNFVRIDVQGMELVILKENEDILKRFKPILSLMVHSYYYQLGNENIENLYLFLRGLGYNVFEYKLFLEKWFGRFKKINETFIIKAKENFYYGEWIAFPENF